MCRYATVFLAIATIFSSCYSIQHMQNTQKIIFFGDSITELGSEPGGYVSIIRDSLKSQNVEIIGAGISGNKVTDLQARLHRDVLSQNPTMVVIYIGINDVWHWVLPNAKGTTKKDFENGLREIISVIKHQGAQVILCTPSVIGEKTDSSNPQDALLDEYSSISRAVAKGTSSTLCDLHKEFRSFLKEHNPSNQEKGILTTDGVHLTGAGNALVAKQLLAILRTSPGK